MTVSCSVARDVAADREASALVLSLGSYKDKQKTRMTKSCRRPVLLAVRAIAMVAERMRLFLQGLSWLPTPFKNIFFKKKFQLRWSNRLTRTF